MGRIYLGSWFEGLESTVIGKAHRGMTPWEGLPTSQWIRKWKMGMLALSCFLLISFFMESFRVGLPSSAKPLWKCPQKHPS